MRGMAVDPTAERGKDWVTERMMELCAVGGCASGAPNQVLVPHRLGGHDIELEVPLCDYHFGWHDAVLKEPA